MFHPGLSRLLDAQVDLVGVPSPQDAVEHPEVDERHAQQVDTDADGHKGQQELEYVDALVQVVVQLFALSQDQNRQERQDEDAHEHRHVVDGRVIVVRDVLLEIFVDYLGELALRAVHHSLVHVGQQSDQHVQNDHH